MVKVGICCTVDLEACVEGSRCQNVHFCTDKSCLYLYVCTVKGALAYPVHAAVCSLQDVRVAHSRRLGAAQNLLRKRHTRARRRALPPVSASVFVLFCTIKASKLSTGTSNQATAASVFALVYQ